MGKNQKSFFERGVIAMAREFDRLMDRVERLEIILDQHEMNFVRCDVCNNEFTNIDNMISIYETGQCCSCDDGGDK